MFSGGLGLLLLSSLEEAATSLFEMGSNLGFWGTMGLIARLLKKCLTFPNFRFWGCSSSGSSSLSTKGGSLNSSCRRAQSFQLSLGSITGSLNTFFSFLKKSGTFSGSQCFFRLSVSRSQLTQRQWQVLPSYWYSQADLSSLSLSRSQMRRAISQNPGSRAYSRVDIPTGVTTLTSAPLSSKYLTSSRWLRLAAMMRGVSPAGPRELTLAPHCSTKYLAMGRFPLKQALERGVILVLPVRGVSRSSGFLSRIFWMLSQSFLSMQQRRYSLSEK